MNDVLPALSNASYALRSLWSEFCETRDRMVSGGSVTEEQCVKIAELMGCFSALALSECLNLASLIASLTIFAQQTDGRNSPPPKLPPQG